ncbi:MAG: UDP-N-acetylglucosamine diphosphorylase/glucosamine-1-phosphate N-acetyltransferase [Armatimonadetes bacterium]|nr:MAG: UDP-N-acetylglucosamine diphosphorylase/glucosamine-1-phosphate N-acetyltransferase [Armatimonadota bacterium]
MGEVAGLILAAGKGTRMKSSLPKVLHPVCGLPMAAHVARAMRQSGTGRIVFVIGAGGELVREALCEYGEFAIQPEQLGSGDACRAGMDALADFEGVVLVAPGDAPLATGAVFQAMLDRLESDVAAVLATANMEDPTGYGRILRDDKGVVRIVEEVDASPEEKGIREVCTSFYAFRADALREALPKLGCDNAKGEYYLTDVVSILRESGYRVETAPIRDSELLMGVNDRWQLAIASEAMRRRLLKEIALSGVTIEDPTSTYVDVDVRVGADTVLHPCTVLRGRTVIGERCDIGPAVRIENSTVGDETTILMSHVNEASIGRTCRIGPFANLRPGCKLGEGVKIGNFVEAKNAELDDGVSAAHLTYLGDVHVGPSTNIGAGTITCNYDGFAKHRTEIGAGVFVGSNTTLIAPLTIGEGAIVAAGSVITHDVPPNAMAVGRARQENKEGYAERWRNKKQSERE